MKNFRIKKFWLAAMSIIAIIVIFGACSKSGRNKGMVESDAAEKVYVAPGTYDEFYAFMSGGFSGQISVYGLPSGRLFKVIPVYSQNPENGYGYTEETKPMLMTSHGFIPWDDAHHPDLSQTNGVPDGRWIFINGNNTPRIARINLKTFETNEIIEIPNTGGNHASAFVTPNTEYVVSATRFSVPYPQSDVSIADYKKYFKGAISYIKVDQVSGKMSLAFQILMPGFDYDLAHSGKGPSFGWSFFTCYNSEQASTLLEVNASKNDKDFIAAVNWKKAEEAVAAGKFKIMNCNYFHNTYNDETHSATTEKLTSVKVLDPKEVPGLIYYLPTPKSPHGVDVDPTGEYIACGGKLAAMIPVHSFTKMKKAIEEKKFDGEIDGIPILKYDAVIAGEVKDCGLGPLHTEFDGKGYAYTSAFITSEVVKWKVGTWQVVDRIPSYYSIGHLMVPGGDCAKPFGKYLVALNKITKDRYLPTGPEMCQSAQLIDISGDKMKLLLDFPTIGEPHYAQAIPAEILVKNNQRIFPIEQNKHPYAAKGEKEAKVVREGSNVHIYMTMTRSHFMPDNIEGVKVGDNVYIHTTNLEQDWDVPHGFAILGAEYSELLVMPGQTRTLVWRPKEVGVYPFYCTDFCSALHQEMSGYIRVSNTNIPISYNSSK
ncbi:MAG: Sec-dependent nitrous-oxide reductase [Ignavibacteriae bacterium]|nr:Sec-dependent nitrous-oxide reductase [Ignavibacteriota bacterium]